MRRLVVFGILLLFVEYINAQVVENPVFDRTDVSTFRVQKVEITKDTTFVSCIYKAEENSWANISKDTYLESIHDGKRYSIIKVCNLPFSPEKKHFKESQDVQVVLCFPQITTHKFNIIENEEENAFNIYGIDLTQSYHSSYTSKDIEYFFDSYQKEEDVGNWASALEYTQRQFEATNYVEGIRSFSSVCSIYNMIMAYFPLKKYEKVIEWGKKAIDVLRELPQDSIILDVLARTYGNIGTAYNLLKKRDEAANYMELSLAIRRQKEGVGALNYEEYLKEMAKKYYYEDNFPKALLYGKEIVDIYKKKYCDNPYKYECVYINALNNLCEYYQKMGKEDESVSSGMRALELIDNGRCDEYPWLKPAIYNNLGGALISSGKVDEGLSFLEAALSARTTDHFTDQRDDLSTRIQIASTYLYYKRDTLKALNEYQSILQIIEDSLSVGKSNYPSYATILENMYEIHRRTNPDTALQYLNKAIKIQKEWQGENTIAYANLLLEKVRNIWGPSLAENKNIDSLLLYMRRATDIVKKHINYTSHNMSSDERKRYWLRYKEYFTWLIPTISGMVNMDDGNSLAYDAALFYKGMLLSSERDIKSIIQNCNDEDLKNRYMEYTNSLTMLEKLCAVGSVGRNIDSLKSSIQNNEYLLSQKITRFNHRFKGTDYTWKEIKNQLQEEDVALEILSYRSLDGKNIYYNAYAIRNNSTAPQLIFLCTENQLKSLTTDSIDYEGLSMLIWGNEKLHDAIKDAKNIYFSTAGLLNTIGIEYLPIAGGRYIYDKFNLFRLSSTREICMKNDIESVDKAYLYGGLDYNSEAEQSNSKETFHERLSRSAIESLILRGGFDLLEGSLQEVELIKSEMSKHQMECVVFSGSTGTEESIKKLSGSNLGILHLSTHGVYLPDDDGNVRKAQNLRFVITDKTAYVDEEDMLLSHSFLVMAGGNALIHRDSIPMEDEDGFLTALEISHLDFSNLDLAVLSACETALGRIDTEGVYGLQRGFKKAGANTILMSLDKVDDEATRILMVEFYRNLMSGKTKLQSLKDAQKHLRQVENGKYDDPKYWASFIMLDGLH